MPRASDGLSRSFLVIALATALACAVNFADPDLWMHIKVGQCILATWHIPATDVYSYSAAGLPWRNHEWLAQVILAMAYNTLGVAGLKLIKLLCAIITIASLAVALARTAGSPAVRRVMLLTAAAGIASDVQFRPQIFTLTMLSFVLASLATEVYRGRAKLWALIPAFALWANLHGGFLAGLGALGIASLLLALQTLWVRGRATAAARMGSVTAACALATLLNPFGSTVWSRVIHSISDPMTRLFVKDWLPLPQMLEYQWHNSKIQILPYLIPLVLFGALASLLLVDVVTTVRGIHFFDIHRSAIDLSEGPTLSVSSASSRFADIALIAVAITFTCAAFYSCRNTPLAVLAVSIPLAHRFGSIGFGSRRRRTAPKRFQEQAPHPALLAISAVLVILPGGLFSLRLKTWEPVPRGAVIFMKRHGLHGNILNNFDWGEYLVWHLPQSHIFIDGRCELVYPDELLAEYLNFFYARPNGKRLLDRYPHDFALVKLNTGGFRLVSTDPRWKEIYHDSISALFARSESFDLTLMLGSSPAVNTSFP